MAPQTIPVAIDKCTYRASIRNVIEYCLVNKQEKRYQKSAAPWYQRCSIGVLLVYLCCTTRKAIVLDSILTFILTSSLSSSYPHLHPGPLTFTLTPSHLPSYPHTYPHHWNPDRQGISGGKWGCEGKKRKKVFLSRRVDKEIWIGFLIQTKQAKRQA